MNLKKGKWYKFDPYNKDWSTTWYSKANMDIKHKERVDNVEFIGVNNTNPLNWGLMHHNSVPKADEIISKCRGFKLTINK